MDRDEFMKLETSEMVFLAKEAERYELEEMAESAGGWEAMVWSVHAGSAVNAMDPQRNLQKHLRSYFGVAPKVGAKKVGILRLYPIGLGVLPGGGHDEDLHAQESLDCYFALTHDGWRKAWGWARHISQETGGVELLNFPKGSWLRSAA